MMAECHNNTEISDVLHYLYSYYLCNLHRYYVC